MPDTIKARSAVKVSEQTTTLSPFAGKPAPKEMLLDARLEREYFSRLPLIRWVEPRDRIGNLNEIYGLDIKVVNPTIDPTFSFMTVDHDGKIRMDCSSPYAMARLVALKDQFQVAFANDPDSDRHGIVTPVAG